ncbi:MAG: AMP-binding protein, partial [Chloroflexota bacterium]|nr:AMP-binding protein [Chloroflexota bacterium]
LSSVRKVVVSNQAAYEDDLRELVNFFPALEYSGILRGFGSSETGLYFMVLPSNKIAAGFMDGATQKERQRLHSLGKPILFGKVKVVDDSRQPIPAGETGEIVVGGDTVMQGYWNNPEATAEVIEDGWYYTKDLGAFDDDGYLYFRGRKDDMIRSGGVFVAPAEVEEIVLKLSPIQEAAVFGTPHEMWGEAVTAAVVLKPDQSISEAEIRDHCRKHLAGFQIPKTIHFMEALPRDGQSNKVLVTELRRTYGKQ